MKNALEILQFISYSTNAEVSKCSSWGNVKNEALNGLNRALRLLWNTKEWNFRREIRKTSLQSGKNSLGLNGGILAQGGIKIANTSLKYDRAIPFYEPDDGKPTSYYITNQGKVVVFPTPNVKYNITVETYTPYPIIGSDGGGKAEITEETDVLNIPQNLEPLFMDCLSYLVNEILNGDPTDEDYSEASLRHSEVYRLLEKADTPKDYDDSKGFKMPWQM